MQLHAKQNESYLAAINLPRGDVFHKTGLIPATSRGTVVVLLPSMRVSKMLMVFLWAFAEQKGDFATAIKQKPARAAGLLELHKSNAGLLLSADNGSNSGHFRSFLLQLIAAFLLVQDSGCDIAFFNFP